VERSRARGGFAGTNTVHLLPLSVFHVRPDNILLSCPLISFALSIWKGARSTVVLPHEKLELELAGSFETSFSESDANSLAWPIPNILESPENNYVHSDLMPRGQLYTYSSMIMLGLTICSPAPPPSR